MSKMKHRLVATWRGSLSLVFIVVALLTLNVGCSQKKSDQRLTILEDQVKMLMTSEAQTGFRELFKTTFNPDKTRILLGADLQKWFQEHHRSLAAVPDPIKELIRSNQGVALLIREGLSGKNGGSRDVVYLRSSPFGGIRFFGEADPDPCGDGNPATCDFCSGCSGEAGPGGTIHTCVCTETCGTCVPCPTC